MGEQSKKPTRQSEEIMKMNEVQTKWNNLLRTYSNGQINAFLQTAGQFFQNDPYLLNQRLKTLSSRQSFKNRDVIENALMEPGANEQSLREATHSIMNTTYPLYRLMLLYEGLLTYHSYIYPTYVKKEEMDKPRFLNDWKFVDKWHKKLNPKKEFRRIVGEVLPEGKRAYYFRQCYKKQKQQGEENEVDYVHFQLLPSDWYKIIKHSTDSYEVIAFNFAYFWQAGTNLGQFPPIFAKYYEEMMQAVEVKKGNRYINPAKTPKDVVVEYNNETMQYFYWKELPADECFVFCFTESDDLQVSPFVSLLLQAQDLASYSLLQQQLLTIPLYSLILGKIPMHDNNKQGQALDDYRLQPEAVSLFESKVNGAMPPGTTYKMVPSDNNTFYTFQEIPNANKIYNDGLQQMINTTGTSTLMTTTEKPSVAQVNAGKIIEKRYIDRMYDQFEKAVNVILGNMYDEGVLRYEWRFKIYGDAFGDRDAMKDTENALSLGQTYLLPEYLGYRDISLLDSITMSDWVQSSNIYDKFKILVNSYTQTNNTKTDIKEGTTEEGGRPKLKEQEIENDNTAAQMDGGTNEVANR